MNCFTATDRAAWRNWLSTHFRTESEVWLVFPAAASGTPGVSYNDAVEEALCFGWIDGQAGKLGDTATVRRFTPRRAGSSYSRLNIERLIWLEKNGLLLPEIRTAVLPIIEAPFIYPPDILAAIEKDATVKANFYRFGEPYRRVRVASVDAVRANPAEFEKRLSRLIEKTRKNRLIIGFGWDEKYFIADP